MPADIVRISGGSVLMVVLLASATVRADVDLTPVPSTYELDGVRMSNVLFKDGEREIAYSPPAGWRVSGSGQRLTLVPSSLANTDARLEVHPRTAVVPFDERNRNTFVARSQKMLPREAREISLLRTKLNPLKICGYDTLAVELQYEAFGVNYRSHALYLNRAHDSWVFHFTAPSSAFEKSFEPFRMSLYSLTGL